MLEFSKNITADGFIHEQYGRGRGRGRGKLRQVFFLQNLSCLLRVSFSRNCILVEGESLRDSASIGYWIRKR